MKIKVTFFGMLVDETGTSSIIKENIFSTNELLEDLENEFSGLKESKYKLALNKEITDKNINLKNGDEIALMPPFAGG